jgi:hypothetical protein
VVIDWVVMQEQALSCFLARDEEASLQGKLFDKDPRDLLGRKQHWGAETKQKADAPEERRLFPQSLSRYYQAY